MVSSGSRLNLSAIKGALIESIGLAFTWASCAWLSRVRSRGVSGLPKTSRVLRRADVFPVTTFYEDPLWTVDDLALAEKQLRALPGIDFRLGEQEPNRCFDGEFLLFSFLIFFPPVYMLTVMSTNA